MKKIKEIILKVLFEEDYLIYSEHEKVIENLIKTNNNKILDKELIIKNLEKDNNYLIQYFDEVLKIQDDHKQVLGFEKNKHENVIVTKWINNSTFWIVLYSPTYGNLKPRIMSTIYKNEVLGWNHIHIDDIIMENNNIGNGSIAMKYFIRIANELEFDKITGNLSSVDKEHWDRSIHFYEKFGFKVQINEQRTSGNIELKLNKNEQNNSL